MLQTSSPSTVNGLATKKRRGRPKKMTNPSGIKPIEFNVLVKRKIVEEKVGSIYLAPTTVEKEQAAAIEGEIIDVSPFAFGYEDWGNMPKPKAGQRVIFAQYTGMKVKGNDGEEYLLIKDKDVVAIRD